MLSYVVFWIVRLFYALHVWSSLLLHTVTLSLTFVPHIFTARDRGIDGLLREIEALEKF